MTKKQSSKRQMGDKLKMTYFNEHEKYSKIYGENTLFMMQVGGFFEMYCTKEEGYNLHKLSDILNILTTKVGKDKPLSKMAPYMMGFPLHALDKYIKLLINYGYHVVLMEQTQPPPNVKIEVTQIFSPSTYIENIS